ncbi:MAG: PucR family transcriptional regulator [Streptosporangiales bacterium]|nr:PucR family transcriptional regulator [Streptosporangiales bacterium]
MEQQLPWFAAMSAEDRSWVGLVAQAGIASFTEWLRHPTRQPKVFGEVFGTAPRELARKVSLQQTVELVRATHELVESYVAELAAPGDESGLREALLVYSREIAFASAQVYAQAAEARGAWDARLEALVVDAVLRGEADESIASRASALGWPAPDRIVVVVGSRPDTDPETAVSNVHRRARHAHLEVLAGVQSDHLAILLGSVSDPLAVAAEFADEFGKGPVVVGPVVADLRAAVRSAQEAFAAERAVIAWPDAPRLIASADVLPERALDGDAAARQHLVREVYEPLTANPVLLETVGAYLDQGHSLEACARTLYVHPNTVRYRLRRVTEVTGYPPTTSRGAFTLRLALAFGRLGDPA